MRRIMFVCHGNICRSPMAEAVMQDIVNRAGKSGEYHIVSRATSTEEIGNTIHYGTRRVLDREGIPYSHSKIAERVCDTDYDHYDLFVIMDSNNARNMRRIGDRFSVDKDDKVHLLMEYVGEMRDVADPWYTGDFESTYNDVKRGCEALFCRLEGENN